jgi:hypothetical protein
MFCKSRTFEGEHRFKKRVVCRFASFFGGALLSITTFLVVSTCSSNLLAEAVAKNL